MDRGKCDYASLCPCGCGWAVCGIYGDWVERSDCEVCGDFDPMGTNQEEEETDHEEDQVPVPEGD